MFFSHKFFLRANSIEFLDNILEVSLKKILVPIVETAMPSVLKEKPKLIMIDLPSEEESLSLIMKGEDNWLKACTMHLIAVFQYQKFADSIKKFVDASDPLLRETARLCIKRIQVAK